MPDNVYDYLRIFNFIVGVLCFIWLVGGLIKQHRYWNTKTRDLWYSRIMYAIVQCVLSVEAYNTGRGLTVGLVFITIAGVITFKGLNKKGTWGYVA